MRHVPALDGLRAIAVFGVLISHYQFNGGLKFLADILPWGQIGVRFFFVLSGFLITSILINCRNFAEKAGLSPLLLLRQFYYRRVLRIFPLYYAVIFFAYILDVGNIREVAVFHIFYLSNTSSALTGTLAGYPPLIDPTTSHFWSLAVEEQFYLFWPFMVLFISRKKLPNLLIFIIILAPLLRLLWFILGYQFMYSYLPLCVDTLGFGAFLALFRNGEFQGLLGRPIILKYIFYFSLVMLLGSFMLHALNIWYRPKIIVMDFFEGIVFTFLINCILAGRFKGLNSLLENRFLRYIGTISYGIYILHAFVPHIIHHVFSIEQNHSLMMFLVNTSVTILIAAITYKVYEDPLNKLKKNYPYDYRKAYYQIGNVMER